MKSLEGVLDKLEAPSESPNGVNHMDDDQDDSADNVIQAGRDSNGAQPSTSAAGGWQWSSLDYVSAYLGISVPLQEQIWQACCRALLVQHRHQRDVDKTLLRSDFAGHLKLC